MNRRRANNPLSFSDGNETINIGRATDIFKPAGIAMVGGLLSVSTSGHTTRKSPDRGERLPTSTLPALNRVLRIAIFRTRFGIGEAPVRTLPLWSLLPLLRTPLKMSIGETFSRNTPGTWSHQEHRKNYILQFLITIPIFLLAPRVNGI